MTWLDLFCLGLFGGSIYLATKRGIILEVTDFFILMVGGFISFRSYRTMGKLLHGSFFSKFNLEFLERFCLIGVFTVIFLVTFAFALNFQRKVNEDKKLDKELDIRMAIAFGFFKTILFIQLFLGFMFYNDAFPRRETKKLKRGPVVSAFLGVSAFAKPVIYIITPSDIAKEFCNKGLGRSVPPTKSDAD